MLVIGHKVPAPPGYDGELPPLTVLCQKTGLDTPVGEKVFILPPPPPPPTRTQ